MDAEFIANAGTLAARSRDLEVALAANLEAERELLRRASEVALPGLIGAGARDVCVRVRTHWPDGVRTATRRRYYGTAGLRLAGRGPIEDHPRANRGRYEGRDLYLLEDGRALILDWGGTWSRWQGAESCARARTNAWAGLGAAADEGFVAEEVVAELARIYAEVACASDPRAETVSSNTKRLLEAADILSGR